MKKATLLFLSLATIFATGCKSDDCIEIRYLGSTTNVVRTYAANDRDEIVPTGELARGRQVRANMSRTITADKIEYVPIATGEKRQIYVESSSLVENARDAVMEREVFVRTPASIIGDRETSKIAGLAGKGAALAVTGYDSIRSDGSVYAYKVRLGKVEGYVYGKYTVFDRSEAKRNYMAEKYDPIHSAVKNPFGGGEALDCDFYPTERVGFADNKMPESCYSLYLNISPAVLSDIESYISLAKRTKINTFVIDIKDNECPGYRAEAMKRYSPTNYAHAGANKEKMYMNAVKRLHEEGFYVVGRITCFKDSYFVKDHPDAAITAKADGKPFKHNKAYWPSAYDRRVWQFNVEL